MGIASYTQRHPCLCESHDLKRLNCRDVEGKIEINSGETWLRVREENSNKYEMRDHRVAKNSRGGMRE